MARNHARIKTTIWSDPDFRSLDVAAQHTYLALTSAPRLSYCGVLDYLPSRLAVLSAGNTESKVKTAVRALERARFVVVDRKTHELLVRSYVRHDGVMDRINMGKAVATALQCVTSATVRDGVLTELARLFSDSPGLLGWVGFKDESPEMFAIASTMASTMPLPMPLGDG